MPRRIGASSSPKKLPVNNDHAACPVLGCPLACLDYEGAVGQVRAWAGASPPRRAYAVAAANTHLVTLARHDPAFGAAMAKFDLWLPDGMPLVWSMNRRLPTAARLRDRVYGPEFMLRCLAATAGKPGESHYLLGGSDELLGALRRKLLGRFPGLEIAGMDSPPFGAWPPEVDEAIFARIAASGARYVWVGLGCPKQEYWISRNLDRLPSAVYFGIGAAFAFHAGKVRQAPAWMQRVGLEWVFRLLAEPRRLFRRYMVYNSLFLWYSLGESGRPPSNLEGRAPSRPLNGLRGGRAYFLMRYQVRLRPIAGFVRPAKPGHHRGHPSTLKNLDAALANPAPDCCSRPPANSPTCTPGSSAR